MFGALPAQASLIGTQVTGTLVNRFGDDLFIGAGIPPTATIADPGIEYSTGDAFLSGLEVDFGANTLTLRLVTLPDYDTTDPFLYFPYTATFTFLTPGLVIGVGVQGGGTVPLASGPTLTGDMPTFETEPFFAEKGDILSVTFEFRLGEGTPVPAPGAFAVFAVALLGLGAARAYRAG